MQSTHALSRNTLVRLARISRAPLGRLSLRKKILLLHIGIVVLAVGLTVGTAIVILGQVVEKRYGERVLSVAHAVALIPSIREAFADPDPSATIQPIAEAVRDQAGFAFIVVANREGIRYSHPVPERIGKRVSTEPGEVLEGESYVAVQRGTLGMSIRAKVPIYDDNEQLIGFVSAGILVSVIQDLLKGYGALLAGIGAISLALGVASSYLLSGHVKRQILGLEPREIALLLEHREAMLHGIREGVVAVDAQGTITLVNDEAARLMGLPPDAVGQGILDVLPDSQLPKVLQSGQAEPDRMMVANGRVIMVSRIPVRSRGQLVGAIATLRDQTEMQELLHELDGTKSHLDTLRAQAHEFANKLHTIAGLMELGSYKEAMAFISQTTREQQELIARLPKQIADPALVALLVGKASVASERRIAFSVHPHRRIRPAMAASDDLVTIVGNLIENALEAVGPDGERSVSVSLWQRGEQITIEVRDSGPGVPAELMPHIFDQGVSTKSDGGRQRGFGLALVQRATQRLGGEITVRNERGAVFTVRVSCGLTHRSSQPTLSLPS